MVMVADDPPVGFARVAFPDGHAHLAQLVVWADQDDEAVRDALVRAVCEQLSVRGQGQVTALVAEGDMLSGFEPLPLDEPRSAHHLVLEAEAESGGQTLSRRALLRHRTTAELTAFLPTLDASPKDKGTVRLVVRRPAVGEREELAGDQLFLDLDLSHENLPEWSLVRFGEPGDGGAVIEVTDQPHNGCAKFIARYGRDAMTFVNGPEGKPRRLRGLCAGVSRQAPYDPVMW